MSVKGSASRFFRAITQAPQTDSLAREYPWQNLKPALSASAPDPDMLESTPAFNYISLGVCPSIRFDRFRREFDFAKSGI
jgi:hypothetical protein